MAATSGNKLVPILAAMAVVIVGTVLYKQFTGAPSAVKAGAELTSVPTPEMPAGKGADGDTPEETLATVVASNRELREQVRQVLEQNRRLQEQNRRLGSGGAMTSPPPPPAASSTATPGASQVVLDAVGDIAPGAQPLPEPEELQPEEEERPSVLGQAIDTATSAFETLANSFPGMPRAGGESAQEARGSEEGARPVTSPIFARRPDGTPPGRVNYQVMAPMGYAVLTDVGNGSGSMGLTRYVRTTVPADPGAGSGSGGTATRAAQQAQQQDAIPYFTLPENATLVGATAMTSLIGRVPIDGRVTDPLQFKAVVGRDNLAANGFELPPDIAGMIVSGVAIGDMALSCTEGKVRSITFVFNDGAIRTVSTGNRNDSITKGSSSDDLGYISDAWGNPCIAGKFVTNAPRYLTDIVGLGALGVAGQAYSEAQRTVYTGNDGSSSSITGNVGHYAMGQAVAGATTEVQKWMLSRLQNSFDAVVIPAGKQLVVHLDKEITLDKAVNGRRLVHRRQRAIAQGGQRYGLQ